MYRAFAFKVALVLGLLALLVAACAPAATPTPAPPPEATPVPEVVELQLMGWSSSAAENTRLQQMIDTFNAQHPTIQVTLNLVPEYDTTLQAALAGGTPPDAFYVDSFRLPDLAGAGSLAVGGGRIEASGDFYPSLREAFTYQGDFYCPPKDFSTLALQYNTAMLEAAGIEVPTTWEELRAGAEALTDAEAGVYGLVLPADFARWIVFLYQAGGSVTDPDFTQMTINTPEAAAALEFYTSLVLDGFATTPSEVGAGWPGEAFGQQKAAMAIEGNWMVPYLEDQFPDVAYGVAELPAGAGGQATMAFTVCYGVPADAAHPEESWTLVNWLTGAEGMQQWTDLGLAMPTRASLQEHWLGQFPDLEPFLAGAAYAHKWQFVPGFGDVLNAVNDNIQRIFAGQQTVEAALAEIEAVGNEVLAR